MKAFRIKENGPVFFPLWAQACLCMALFACSDSQNNGIESLAKPAPIESNSEPFVARQANSLQYGVDFSLISANDMQFVGGLRKRVEKDFGEAGQGGKGYLSWQVPGVLQILVDTERKYYLHSVETMLNRAGFNNPKYFNLGDGQSNRARPSPAISQLVWEEYICHDIMAELCVFNRNTSRTRLIVAGVDQYDAFNTDELLGLKAVINDDRLWWALGFLSVYSSNPGGHQNLLDYAKQIQKTVQKYKKAIGKPGICWEMTGKYTTDNCYENTITNSLYINVAMRLALIAKEQGNLEEYYGHVNEASSLVRHIVSRGTVNSYCGMLADGIGGGDNYDTTNYYTYNQGVALEGLGLLYQETGDEFFLTFGKSLIVSTIRNHTGIGDGIFREFVSDDSNNNFFKAAYFQYLGNFLENIDLTAPESLDFTRLVYSFLKRNSDSVTQFANYDIPNGYDSKSTNYGSNPATRAAALVLKTTYLRMRTFVSKNQEMLRFGIDDNYDYWSTTDGRSDCSRP